MHAPLADVVRRDDGRGVMLGFSGGLDSTVLLHLLAANTDIRRNGLGAIHVHHGLHADADAWAAQCQRSCDALDVPLSIVHVDVDRASGQGLEGAARDARHRAFAQALADDEILALAHHRDDQAETFLLRALRGSGVDGLAAMRSWRAYANGWLWRPLLDVAREELHEHATAHGLAWIEDAGNGDPRFDRNFLRNAVMPLLRQRWPQARISAADFAASMAAKTAAEGTDCVLADIEALPFRPACFDGYWSSLTVQWCDSRRVLAEAARVLKPGGWLSLSTLGEATYSELRTAFAGIDRHQHTLDFSAADQLAEAARTAGLQQVSLHRETITLHYPDLRSLLGAVKAIGANALGPGRRTGMMGKAAWAALSAAYELHRTAAGLPASYDVILLTARR